MSWSRSESCWIFSCARPAGLGFLLVFTLLALDWAYAVQRAPGERRRAEPSQSEFPAKQAWIERAAGIVPGLIELAPGGKPDSASRFDRPFEYQDSLIDRAAYFAARVEAPLRGPFVVLGVKLWFRPAPSGSALVLEEVLVTGEAPRGGPDLGQAYFRQQRVSPAPGADSLLVDLAAEDTLFTGPQVFYVVVRIDPGTVDGQALLLEADTESGLFPGGSWLSVDGDNFVALDRGRLAVGLCLATDSLGVPASPPVLDRIDRTSPDPLRVRLAFPLTLADSRPLGEAPGNVRVTCLAPDMSVDSLIGEFPLSADNWVSIPGLGDKPRLLRFALVSRSGEPGLPSGAYCILAADIYEPNDSRDKAAPLPPWQTPAGRGWSETVAGPGEITSPWDFDFFSLDLAQGDSVVAFLKNPASSGPLEPVLTILDSVGTALAYALGKYSTVSVLARYTGRYYLLVNDRALLDGTGFTGQGTRVYEILLQRLRRRGDVDGNGRIDYRDAFLVFLLTRGLIDLSSITPEMRFAADFDGDGSLEGDLDDFLLLLRLVTYIPNRDPSGPPDKIKPSGGALLAGVNEWRFVFEDGSALDASLHGPVKLAAPGLEARKWLALLDQTEEKVRPGLPVPRFPSLDQNAPNPFNPSTAISFVIPQSGWISLRVFDLRGKCVRTLADGLIAQGAHRVVWDGTDESGRRVAGGVYLYRLETGQARITRKMVLIK